MLQYCCKIFRSHWKTLLHLKLIGNLLKTHFLLVAIFFPAEDKSFNRLPWFSNKYQRLSAEPPVIFEHSARRKVSFKENFDRKELTMKLFILSALLIGLVSGQFRDSRCPLMQTGRETTHLAHPNDCGRFLKCNNGLAFEISCPAGQHWNALGEFCDNPLTAGCMTFQPQPPAPPQRPSMPNPRPEMEHPTYLNCPAGDVPGRMVYYPYHLNCQQFYQCVNGRAVL